MALGFSQIDKLERWFEAAEIGSHQKLWSDMYQRCYDKELTADHETQSSECNPEAGPINQTQEPWEPGFMKQAQLAYADWLIEARRNHEKLRCGGEPDYELECDARERVTTFERMIEGWEDDALERSREFATATATATVAAVDPGTGVITMATVAGSVALSVGDVRMSNKAFFFGLDGITTLGGSSYKEKYEKWIAEAEAEEAVKREDYLISHAYPERVKPLTREMVRRWSELIWENGMPGSPAEKARLEREKSPAAELLLTGKLSEPEGPKYTIGEARRLENLKKDLELQKAVEFLTFRREAREQNLRDKGFEDSPKNSLPRELRGQQNDSGALDEAAFAGSKYDFPVIAGIEHGQTGWPEARAFDLQNAQNAAAQERASEALAKDSREKLLRNAAEQKRIQEELDRNRAFMDYLKGERDVPKREPGLFESIADQDRRLSGELEASMGKEIRAFSKQSPPSASLAETYRSFMITGITPHPAASENSACRTSTEKPDAAATAEQDAAAIREHNRKIMVGS